MAALTVKIPAPLKEKLRLRAKEKKTKVSEIVRNALYREIENEGVDFVTLAAPYQGMFSGPKDLSSREGYGRSKSR
jgi:hypothetical protein